VKLFNLIFAIMICSMSALAEENISKCIAHRGNNKYFLENSIKAIQSAAEIETDGIEIDIRHTKDGHAILMHDSTLKRVAKSRPGRTCPLNKKVKKLTILDIRTNCLLTNGEPIPLLIEALESVSLANIEWFIELKDTPNQNTFQIIKSYIPKYQPKKIISFKRKALMKIKSFIKVIGENPGIEMFKIYRLYLFHQKDFHADVHFTPFNLRKLFKKKRQIKRAVWTVDGSRKLERAIKSNIEYITTNDPELCLFLKRRYIKITRSNNRLSAI
jgi:glycerophosphoryl diester phosphodiesterase